MFEDALHLKAKVAGRSCVESAEITGKEMIVLADDY